MAAVEGMRELKRALAELSAGVQLNALRSAAQAAGRAVVKEAQARIQVGSEAHRTYRGNLVAPGFARRSIVARSYIDKRRGRVGVSVGVRAQAFYAVSFLELERGRSGARGRPWLRPAFEASEQQMLNAYRNALQRAVKRARAKGKK